MALQCQTARIFVRLIHIRKKEMCVKKIKEELQIELIKVITQLNAESKEKVIDFARRLKEAERSLST